MDTDAHGRSYPPEAAGEFDTLVGFLEFQRATIAWKTGDLDDAQLRRRLAPSQISLGGLLHHLAFVEDYWFGYRLAGADPVSPWRDADWDADPDWDWHVADELDADLIRSRWHAAVDQSRSRLSHVERLDQREVRADQEVSARWVLLHMIEEYARHAGHVDLIRESIDGLTGE